MSFYPSLIAVHWTAGPGDFTNSRGEISWEQAWAELDAAFAKHDTLCYCIEWTAGFGPRLVFEWMERSIWHAHGGMGPDILTQYCECFSVPNQFNEATGEPLE
jgi:hypothetical protein